ncbi:NACHT domain-containing protein [Kutzneria sp. NPDC051319]|uniref:NACHT domain-containing protein n=1 Tax=Kutzneria sp. NPDC051319 TaxID=3155047 RepID=UPI00341C11F0
MGRTSNRARLAAALAGGVPAAVGLAEGRPALAFWLLVLCEGAVAVLVYIGDILGDVAAKWRERAVKGLDQAVVRWLSGFGRKYRDFMLPLLRASEAQGPANTGFYQPDLEEIFVDVSLEPRSPDKAQVGLVGDENVGGEERRRLWEFLDRPQPQVLAVLGAPGSGKTTLLRQTGREILKQPRGRRRKVPVLLYLRDHVASIMASPRISVAALLRRELERYNIEDPGNWFERRLMAGSCVVLLDGLDEVARQQDRETVAAWVEHQVRQYPRNDFVVTSRPHGYRTARVTGTIVLQVCNFNDGQVTEFVHRWYSALERKITGGADTARQRADKAAHDLLDRLAQAPSLHQLTVNPLLLTMMANVHRYRGVLPGSRADLYGEICEVMLWRRQETKKLPVELRGDRKEALLRGLAYRMMEQQTRDVPKDVVTTAIRAGLRRMSREVGVEDFLSDVSSNGLLIERESGIFSFAHHTFQEYLAACHVRDKRLAHMLAEKVDDVWWRETTLLYVAGADADQIVAACLESASMTALLLAFDCAEEASELAPELRDRIDGLLDSAYAPGAPADRRRLMAGVLVTRQLRHVVRTAGGGRICARPVTNGLYWLYRQETGWPGPDRKDVRYSRDQPVLGVRGTDAVAFTNWVNKISASQAYRLPDAEQLAELSLPPCAVWIGSGQELWSRQRNPHLVSDSALTRAVTDDVERWNITLARLLLVQALVEARLLTLRLEWALENVRTKAQRRHVRGMDLDVALARVRQRSKDRPLAIAAALERAKGVFGDGRLDEAIDQTREVVRAVALAPKAERRRVLERGAALARELVAELPPVLAAVFALPKALDNTATPDRPMGRMLSNLFDWLFSDATPHNWSARFAEWLCAASRLPEPIIPSPDLLIPMATAARKDMIALYHATDGDDEDEEQDSDSGPSAWSCLAAVALERVAGPVFERREPLADDTVSAIRLAALCLAGEVTDPREVELGRRFRALAAGVTLLQHRSTGHWKPTEMIILATA